MASKKCMTELRGLCQSMGAKWSFSDDRNALEQKISMRQREMLPPVSPTPVPIPPDFRLRTSTPAKVSDEEMIRTLLKPYTDIGLNITFEHGMFHMKHGSKADSGTLRQPPRSILNCARRLME